jgi:ABC-type glycerol-3-phosphate transport system substrate-binding protein
MSRNRFAVPAVLVMVLGLALLAAGTASGSKDSVTATSKVTGSISIIAKWTAAEQKAFEAVLAPFKKANPGLKIKYTGVGDNITQVLSTAVTGGRPPDIGQVPQPGLMKQFAARGALKPITFAKAAISKNFQPVWTQLGSVNGKLYGLYFKGANKSTIWYNVKSFKDAGVTPPTTWPQLLTAAKTLRSAGTPAYSIGGADGWTLTDLFENIYLRTAGPAKYDQLTEHKIKWTDPSVKTALKTMADIVGDTGNIAGGADGALQTDFNTSVSNVFSESPKAAMVLEGDFVPGVVAGKNPLKPLTGYNQFAFPSIAGSKPAVMGGGDVLIAFKDNPGVRALIMYLTTPQAAEIWAKLGGYSSPNKFVKASAYPDPISRQTATALAKASVFRFDMSDLAPSEFGGGGGTEWKLLQDFLKNPKDVDGIASKLEAAAAKAYG